MSNQYDPYSQQPAQNTYGNPGQGQPQQYDPYQAPQYGGPPYQGQQYGAPVTPAHASYGSRVGAYLLDGLITLVPLIVFGGLGLWIAFKDSYEVRNFDGTSTIEGVAASGIVLALVGPLVAFLFNLWNRAIRQGTKGQSLGKKMLHIKVVDERTGQPTGAGIGIGRYLLEAVAGGVSGGLLLIVDLLWPLWDDNKQTLHDKIVHTLVVQGD